MAFIPGVAELQKRNTELKEEIEKIEAAIEVVNAAVSNMKSGEDAGHSYEWIINNVDNYWNVEGSGASSAKSQMVEDLNNLKMNFESGGVFYTSVGGVIGAVNDVIAEKNREIEENNALIDALIQEYQEQIAEEANAEEETETTTETSNLKDRTLKTTTETK